MVVIKSASLQRLTPSGVFAALLLCAVIALPAHADEDREVVSIGVGVAHGGFGVEWLRTLTDRLAVAAGGGVGGFGGRIQLRSERTPFGPFTSTSYLSAGGAVFAWGDRYTESNGMVLLEGGFQLWPQAKGLYADIGGGIGFAVGDTTRGNRVVPTFRLLLGHTIR